MTRYEFKTKSELGRNHFVVRFNGITFKWQYWNVNLHGWYSSRRAEAITALEMDRSGIHSTMNSLYGLIISSFWSGNSPQNSRIHSQKNNSNLNFGVVSTINKNESTGITPASLALNSSTSREKMHKEQQHNGCFAKYPIIFSNLNGKWCWSLINLENKLVMTWGIGRIGIPWNEQICSLNLLK